MKILRMYIAQSLFFRKKEANEVRCNQNSYLGFYTSENILFIYLFWLNNIAPKFFSKMMYVS